MLLLLLLALLLFTCFGSLAVRRLCTVHLTLDDDEAVICLTLNCRCDEAIRPQYG